MVQEWTTKDILIKMSIRVDGQKHRTAFLVASQEAQVDQLALAAVDYLKLTNYPQLHEIAHSMTWVSSRKIELKSKC